MRVTPIVCLLAFGTACLSAAGSAPAHPWTHTRPVTPGAASLLAEAAGRSPVVTSLLQDLEGTDVVVYLSDALSGSPGAPRAYLSFVAYAAGTRYLLIHVDRWRLQPAERAIWLGHELEHALEVAAAPEVRDAGTLADLYRRIGWQTVGGHFETEHAWDIATLVRAAPTARPH
jgi:hypothetical protein